MASMKSFCDKTTSEFFQDSLPLIIGSILALGIGRFATSINDDLLIPLLKRSLNTYEDSMFVVLRKGKRNEYFCVQDTIDDPDCVAIRYANIITDLMLFILIVFIIILFTRLYCQIFTTKKRWLS